MTKKKNMFQFLTKFININFYQIRANMNNEVLNEIFNYILQKNV